MKLTTILLIVTFLQVSAASLAQNITYKNNSASLEQIFKEIRKQTGYNVLVSSSNIKNIQPQPVNFENASLNEVLNKTLKGKPLAYSIEDKTVLIRYQLITTADVADLPPPVTGKVVDSTGAPLPGASIRLKGTNEGTVADANGKFSIDAPDNSILVVSYVGYATKEVTLSTHTAVTIVLSSSNDLNSVVITAFGVKKEDRKLGYSVTQVSGAEVSLARETTFINALAGKVAGLVVQSPPNGAGGSTRVILRGYSSFSGDNQPLYVVDGVPINSSTRSSGGYVYGGSDAGDGLSSINPDDIESISVLKGASAAALYGGSAQSGVILITTKKGSKKTGWDINFNSNTVIEKEVPYTELQNEYGRGDNGLAYTTATNPTNDNYLTGESWGVKINGQQEIGADGKLDPYVAQTAAERFDQFFKLGLTSTNSLSLTKTTETGATRVSLSDTRDNTPTPGAGYERYNVVIRSTQEYGKKLHTDFKLDASRVLRLNAPLLGGDDRGSFSKYFIRSANTTPITFLDDKDASGNYLYTYTNPYIDVEKVKNDQTQNRVLASGNVTYDITDHFHANLITGLDWLSTTSLFVNFPNNKNGNGQISDGSINQQRSDVRGLLSYDNKFHNFSFSAFGGFEAENSIFSSLSITGSNLVDPTLTNLSNVTTGQPTQITTPHSITNSVFGEAQFGYKNYLFLEVTGRNDWYSSLASSRPNFLDHVFYPSANLSYVFTDALKIDPSILSSGKIRIAVGETGSNPTPQQTDLSFGFTPVVNGNSGATILNSNLPPTHLKPETTTETEIGTQLSFFADRLYVDAAYYYKKSKNFLLPIELPIETGYTGTYQNAGSMYNKGIELLVNGTPVKSHNFSWDISVNYARNKNLVTQLNGNLANGVSLYNNIEAQVGYPLGSIFGNPERRDASGNLLYKAISTNGTGVDNAVVIDRGALTFDKNGNALTDASGALIVNSNTFLGSANPNWTGGITNTFKYKNFSLSFLIDGQFGGYIYEDGYKWASFFGNTKASLQGRDGTYVPTGSVNIGTDAAPKYVKNTLPFSPYQQYNGGGTLAYYTDEFSVFKRTFIKFRQVSLGYTIPKNILAGTFVKSATLSLVARNLFFLKKDLPIFDPESSDEIGNGNGYDTGGLPTSRTYGFNLNVGF